jgi:hypothetical protein
MSEKGQGELIIIVLFFVFICILSEFVLEGGGLISYVWDLFFDDEPDPPRTSNTGNNYALPCMMRVDYKVDVVHVIDSEDLGGDEPYIFYELFYVDGGGVVRSYSSAVWSSSEELESGTILGDMYGGWPHKVGFNASDALDIADSAFGGPPKMVSVSIPAPFVGFVGVYIQLMESDLDRAAEFARETMDILEDVGAEKIVGSYLPDKCKLGGKNLCIIGGKIWAKYKSVFDSDEFLGEDGYRLTTAQLDRMIGAGQTQLIVHNFSGWDKLTPFEYDVQTVMIPRYYDFRCR